MLYLVAAIFQLLYTDEGVQINALSLICTGAVYIFDNPKLQLYHEFELSFEKYTDNHVKMKIIQYQLMED